MNNFRHLRNVLNYNIKKMDECTAIFCENPDKDFTRNRIFDFETVIKNVICLESGSLQDELLKLYEFSLMTPTSSAFIHARDKIKFEAFKILFERFNVKTQKEKLYKGYRLLAVDGTELPIDNSIYDKETTVLRRGAAVKPYSGYHITALYDLIECTYEDLVIHGEATRNEHTALCNMIDRYNGHQAIIIGDRLFESYNNYEHITNSGNKYLIRVRDIESTSSITKSLGPFPETDEFDIDVFRMLTLKQNKMIKACPQLYKFMLPIMNFDYMNKDNSFYEFNCRIVRFKITDDTYECIMTNLDRTEFPLGEIKELYNKRWGIETSFRELKYAIGLNALHSKKRKKNINIRLISQGLFTY